MPDETGTRAPGYHPPPVGHRALGPLGRRLVLAFSLVSLVAVGLFVLAAQQAVNRGLSAATGVSRWATAERLADLAAAAYADAGGWSGADLAPVLDAAEDAGVRVSVRDLDGDLLAQTGGANGHGPRLGAGVTVQVSAEGTDGAGPPVGSVSLGGSMMSEARAEALGRDIAWSWILAAAAVSLAFAVLAAWFVTRRLTRPLAELSAVTRSFASGNRAARADESAVGELGEVARGFNDALESAERSADLRRQMAADVAHELRTPLAALQAGLEEVRDGLQPADGATISRLHDQAVRLGRVVGDLGVLASAEDARLGLASGHTDLARIVAEELDARAPELRAAGLTLRTVRLSPVEVVADGDRMHQVVGNVLANCARHARAGDAVDVEVAASDGEAVVRVADTGPGIRADDLPHVFDRYWRGSNGGVVGSGLGLAVVREIVTAHGGRVDIASPPSGGTLVEIRLPAAAPAPRERIG